MGVARGVATVMIAPNFRQRLQDLSVKLTVLHDINLEDSKDTVIVTGIGEDPKTEEFVSHFRNVGNIIKSHMRRERPEGIVTYADPKTAKRAAETLNDSQLKGSVINVLLADRFYNCYQGRRDHISSNIVNSAWQLWMRENENGFQYDRTVEQRSGGGKWDKGGCGGPIVLSEHDGEDGNAGPGGKGGAVATPAVASHCEDGWQFERNNDHGGGGGGKGGKGGRGGPNVPSGHDGQDGEPGPGGKGGAGGRPAVTNANLGEREYVWNTGGNNDPWYTRLFGIGVGNDKRPPVDNEYKSAGGGNGGQGGQGSFDVQNGHAGEDGEAGPFGKGGRGGKPAL